MSVSISPKRIAQTFTALMTTAPCAAAIAQESRGVNPASIDSRFDVIVKRIRLEPTGDTRRLTFKCDYKLNTQCGMNFELPVYTKLSLRVFRALATATFSSVHAGSCLQAPGPAAHLSRPCCPWPARTSSAPGANSSTRVPLRCGPSCAASWPQLFRFVRHLPVRRHGAGLRAGVEQTQTCADSRGARCRGTAGATGAPSKPIVATAWESTVAPDHGIHTVWKRQARNAIVVIADRA